MGVGWISFTDVNYGRFGESRCGVEMEGNGIKWVVL